MFKSSVSLFCLVFLIVFATQKISSAQENEGIELTFGVYTSQKPSTQIKVTRPILDALENAMSRDLKKSVKIKLHVTNTYEEGVSLLLDQTFDFARMGAASIVLAEQKDQGIQLLTSENEKGLIFFNGIIAVKANSAIQSIEDLEQKTFAFGSNRSTIGRYFAQKILSENGIFESSLKEYKYLGRHDLVGYAISKGSFDAGALNEKVFKELNDDGHDLRAISTFPVLTRTWVARSGFSSEIASALKKALLNLEDIDALAPINIGGFLEVRPKDLEDIREAILNNTSFFKN